MVGPQRGRVTLLWLTLLGGVEVVVSAQLRVDPDVLWRQAALGIVMPVTTMNRIIGDIHRYFLPSHLQGPVLVGGTSLIVAGHLMLTTVMALAIVYWYRRWLRKEGLSSQIITWFCSLFFLACCLSTTMALYHGIQQMDLALSDPLADQPFQTLQQAALFHPWQLLVLCIGWVLFRLSPKMLFFGAAIQMTPHLLTMYSRPSLTAALSMLVRLVIPVCAMRNCTTTTHSKDEYSDTAGPLVLNWQSAQFPPGDHTAQVIFEAQKAQLRIGLIPLLALYTGAMMLCPLVNLGLRESVSVVGLLAVVATNQVQTQPARLLHKSWYPSLHIVSMAASGLFIVVQAQLALQTYWLVEHTKPDWQLFGWDNHSGLNIMNFADMVSVTLCCLSMRLLHLPPFVVVIGMGFSVIPHLIGLAKLDTSMFFWLSTALFIVSAFGTVLVWPYYGRASILCVMLCGCSTSLQRSYVGEGLRPTQQLVAHGIVLDIKLLCMMISQFHAFLSQQNFVLYLDDRLQEKKEAIPRKFDFVGFQRAERLATQAILGLTACLAGSYAIALVPSMF